MREIRINHAGDGDWIMKRAGGVFRPPYDHSIATHRDGEILGGFVLSSYMGGAIAVHNAGADPMWCTRDLMWMLFDYVFHQLHCVKLLAPTVSDNHRALSQNLRAGFHVDVIIQDAIAPGRHLMVLTMTMADCRWLRIIPQSYLQGARRVQHDG